jgi:hypothetical protein
MAARKDAFKFGDITPSILRQGFHRRQGYGGQVVGQGRKGASDLRFRFLKSCRCRMPRRKQLSTLRSTRMVPIFTGPIWIFISDGSNSNRLLIRWRLKRQSRRATSSMCVMALSFVLDAFFVAILLARCADAFQSRGSARPRAACARPHGSEPIAC